MCFFVNCGLYSCVFVLVLLWCCGWIRVTTEYKIKPDFYREHGDIEGHWGLRKRSGAIWSRFEIFWRLIWMFIDGHHTSITLMVSTLNPYKC